MVEVLEDLEDEVEDDVGVLTAATLPRLPKRARGGSVSSLGS